MSSPDAGRFTPESALPISLDSSQDTGRGSERFWKLFGAGLVGVALGAAVGTVIGAGIVAGPSFVFNSENIAFVGKVAGSFGLLGGVLGVARYFLER